MSETATKLHEVAKPISPYSCANCHFAFIMENAPVALCRRFPPTVYQSELEIQRDDSGKILKQGQTLAQFPVVMQSNWCGEHKRVKGELK